MLVLLTLFFCHFLADYTWFSRPHMLLAKRLGAPVGPIWEHAGVHALLMWGALLALGVPSEKANCLFFVQLFSHFAIDLLKGRLNKWFTMLRDPQRVEHWVVFGLDQYAHTAVILLMWAATRRP